MTQPNQPGRLGNPDLTFATDHRADPRIARVMAAMDAISDGIEAIGVDSSYEQCLAYCQAFEDQGAVANPALLQSMPAFETVAQTTETIKGVADNDIPLYLHMPKDRLEPGPCVIHTHGGGMVMMAAEDPGFILWRNNLAAVGIRTVGVEFRNGGGKLGNHPFPAGLNDCASAVHWVHENREQLGVTSIVISGESGGGNLAIATTLKAKQEGWLEQIDGVYACCPYIYGDYLNPAPELTSLHENDGYMLKCSDMGVLTKVYDPDDAHSTNPLAWPYHASRQDLQGLPPHVISVNELDPLRDEGLEFYRKLMAAGVPAIARTVHGTPHAGDLSFPQQAPDLFLETLRSLSGFAESLATG